MFIKSLYEPHEFDVFLGQGWENWLRVSLKGNELVVKQKAEHVGDISPNTWKLIFHKIKKHIKKEKENG